MTEKLLPITERNGEQQLLGQLCGVAEQFTDEILDHPEYFDLTPDKDGVPQYAGTGERHAFRGTTSNGIHIDASRIVATDPEAFDPDRQWKSWHLRVVADETRLDIVYSERLRGLIHAGFRDSAPVIDLLDAKNAGRIDDALTLLELVIDDASQKGSETN